MLPALVRTYLRDARVGFAHAPLEVLIGVAVAISFSASLNGPRFEEEWIRVLAWALIGLPLVFAVSVLHMRGIGDAGWCRRRFSPEWRRTPPGGSRPIGMPRVGARRFWRALHFSASR